MATSRSSVTARIQAARAAVAVARERALEIEGRRARRTIALRSLRRARAEAKRASARREMDAAIAAKVARQANDRRALVREAEREAEGARALRNALAQKRRKEAKREAEEAAREKAERAAKRKKKPAPAKKPAKGKTKKPAKKPAKAEKSAKKPAKKKPAKKKPAKGKKKPVEVEAGSVEVEAPAARGEETKFPPVEVKELVTPMDLWALRVRAIRDRLYGDGTIVDTYPVDGMHGRAVVPDGIVRPFTTFRGQRGWHVGISVRRLLDRLEIPEIVKEVEPFAYELFSQSGFSRAYGYSNLRLSEYATALLGSPGPTEFVEEDEDDPEAPQFIQTWQGVISRDTPTGMVSALWKKLVDLEDEIGMHGAAIVEYVVLRLYEDDGDQNASERSRGRRGGGG